MQRHTDLVVNGWDVESVRTLKEAIGKRQLIVRKALNEIEIYKDAIYEISEILVDISKSHYTDEDGIEEIKDALDYWSVIWADIRES
ncbi:MAG: hypothetical protein M0P69_11305 [Bacteroidales bacterium]|nr:hypothetical protein [Bacteroidales bacterium]